MLIQKEQDALEIWEALESDFGVTNGFSARSLAAEIGIPRWRVYHGIHFLKHVLQEPNRQPLCRQTVNNDETGRREQRYFLATDWAGDHVPHQLSELKNMRTRLATAYHTENAALLKWQGGVGITLRRRMVRQLQRSLEDIDDYLETMQEVEVNSNHRS